jgi:hypothetical protein
MALLGRRRDERLARHLRLAMNRSLRGGTLSPDQTVAMQFALDDQDAFDEVLEQAQAQRLAALLPPVEGGRDWAGFFDALATFLERIIPLLLKLFMPAA